MKANANTIKKNVNSLAMGLGNWKRGMNVSNSNLLRGLTNPNKAGYTQNIERSNPIEFKNIHVGRHTIPTSLSKSQQNSVSLKLTMILEANLKSQDISFIEKLGIDFVINGKLDDKSLISSWHLDLDSTDEDKKKEDRITHPLFHLNFGGKNMKSGEYGQLICFDSPRVVHHPMDVILAIDFILRNFYLEIDHEEITSQPWYKEILRFSSEKYLRPYYQDIFDNISSRSVCRTLPSLNY
jgi:hypothetical protein